HIQSTSIENSYLIVIWERNDTCAYTQDHTWMNLTVRPRMSLLMCFGLLPLRQISLLLNLITCLHLSRHLKVLRRHGNHRSLFFLRSNILNNTIGQQTMPPATVLGVEILIVLEALDMMLLQGKLSLTAAAVVRFNDIPWSADTSGIRKDLDLSLTNVPNQADFG